MKVRDLAERVLLLQSFTSDIWVQDPGNKQDGHNCRRSHPRPARPLTRSTRDLLLNALAKFGARAVTLSCGLRRALHLHTDEHIGGAWRAVANMSVDGLHLARGKFSVKICIEFCGEFVGHHVPPSFF